ncbi:MAG: AAA family ATPase [bacterium]
MTEPVEHGKIMLGFMPRSSEAYHAIYKKIYELEHTPSHVKEEMVTKKQLKFQVEVAKKLFLEKDCTLVDGAKLRACYKRMQSICGLKSPKKNLLAILASSAFNSDMKPIPLLLAGPPGVGKTSLAAAAAGGLERKLQVISLGGRVDPDYLRGTRPMWLGAEPGMIAKAYSRYGKKLMFMFDEIDKLESGANASFTLKQTDLLSVFDSSQNFAFNDFYLDYPIDLSSLPMIATANSLDTLLDPLVNRFEVIELGDYSVEEKLVIASDYIAPRLLQEMGLVGKFKISIELVDKIIEKNRDQPGMRQIERDLKFILSHAILHYFRGEIKIPAKLNKKAIKLLDNENKPKPRKVGFRTQDE